MRPDWYELYKTVTHVVLHVPQSGAGLHAITILNYYRLNDETHPCDIEITNEAI